MPAKRVFFVFLYILLLWTAYRYFFQLPEWVDEFIVKPIFQLGPVAFVVWHIEKKGISSLGFTKKRLFPNIVIGLWIGVFLVAEAIVSQLAAGKSVQLGAVAVSAGPFILSAFISFATGLVEETVFRGYFFSRLEELGHHPYVATVGSAVLFVIAHLPVMAFSLRYTGMPAVMYCVQIFVLGLAFGFTFLYTRSIVPSTIAHFLWNFSNVLLK